MADNLNYPNPGTGTVIAFRDAAGTGAGPYFQRIDTAGIVAHDGAAASYYPLLVGGYASAAAPTGVSADGDAVQGWFLRNGAQCVQITASGAIIPGDATNGLKVQAAGDIAHGSSDSGNPVKQGRVAIAHGTDPTAVSAGQRTNIYANAAGIPFVIGGHPNVKTIRYSFTASVSNQPVIAGVGGTRIIVTAFMFTIDNATTVFPLVFLGFGTTTTPTTTQVIGAHPAIPAGGGFSRGDGSGIIGIGASGDSLLITTSGTVGGGGAYLVVTYYTITV